MSKKEKLIQVLKELENSWELAPGLLILVKESPDDTNMIEGLLNIIDSSIQTTEDVFMKKRLESAYKKLQEIQRLEAIEQQESRKYAQELLQTLL